MIANDKVEVKTEYKAEDFAKEYQALCDKTKFRIVVSPVWTARDDGTWSMVLQFSIGKIAKTS